MIIYHLQDKQNPCSCRVYISDVFQISKVSVAWEHKVPSCYCERPGGHCAIFSAFAAAV